MIERRVNRVWVAVFLLISSVAVLAGCVTQTSAETVESQSGYTGSLDASYPSALDVASQLAMGTLQLEGTAYTVTEDQAADLLPLWRALQGSELQGDAEWDAVLRQIEAAMTEDQLSSIAAMRLTQEDAQAWLQDEGRGVSAVALRTQIGGSGSAGGGMVGGIIGAIVDLLIDRSSAATALAVEPDTTSLTSLTVGATVAKVVEPTEPQLTVVREAALAPVTAAKDAVADAQQPPSTTEVAYIGAPDDALEPTSEAVVHVVQYGDTLTAIASVYGVTVEAIIEANVILDRNAIDIGQELVIPDPARVPEAMDMGSAEPVGNSTVVAAETLPGLEQLPDNDPGPPLTIEVSASYSLQDPLVEGSRTYVVTGIVRNDGDETYAVSDIRVTFYDAEGFRGTFEPAIRDGKVVGGEWHWHGETEAEFAALLLAPGEEWPFRVAIVAQDMASFLIHPDAAPTGRESVPVVLSDVQVMDEGTNYVRISGTATNSHPFKVKNVTVSGVLLDANGHVVSLGSRYVLQQDIEPGASVHFDVRIEKEAYTGYQLYAQAERDWD